MEKDLTTSEISRQNILNNPLALSRIREALEIKPLEFEGQIVLTKQMVADFYEVDVRTISRYIVKYKAELKYNGYFICKGNRLKEFKLRYVRDINVLNKTPQIGLFDFRSFLNVGMLLTESEKAKQMRSLMLDIVIAVINEKTGGGTKYINRRDKNYIISAIVEENYHHKLADAISKYVKEGERIHTAHFSPITPYSNEKTTTTMKQIILFFLLIVSTIRLSAQSEEWLAYSHLQNDVNRAFSKSDYPKAVPIDTLYIPHNIGYEFSFYSAVEKTQVNSYFSKDYAGHAILHYCVNSLYPTTSFVLDNTFSNYFVVDRNKIIVKYVNDDQMYALDSLSKVTKIIEMNIGTENEEPFMLMTRPFAYYVPVTQDSGLLYARRILTSLNDYKMNPEHRLRKFSKPMITEFTFNNESLAFHRGIGHYPTSHFSKDSIYKHYWFWTAMNKDLDIVTAYFFLDSLYVIHRNNTQSRYPLKSKYQHHENEILDLNELNNYNYLEEKSCESTSYMYLRYDAYRDLYYVAVSKAMPYENGDGTHNFATEKPWSLIILDSEFHQKAEIDMPTHLSKHELLIIPEGLAVKDPTHCDNQKSCFIIYNIAL